MKCPEGNLNKTYAIFFFGGGGGRSGVLWYCAISEWEEIVFDMSGPTLNQSALIIKIPWGLFNYYSCQVGLIGHFDSFKLISEFAIDIFTYRSYIFTKPWN